MQKFEELVEGLSGSNMTVAGLVPRLKVLNEQEALAVFQSLRDRILRTTSLSRKPPGFDGLVALCQHHPPLQAQLARFMEELPAKGLGPWAVTGWGNVFGDQTLRVRMIRQLEAWGEQKGNEKLRRAARIAQRALAGE